MSARYGGRAVEVCRDSELKVRRLRARLVGYLVLDVLQLIVHLAAYVQETVRDH